MGRLGPSYSGGPQGESNKSHCKSDHLAFVRCGKTTLARIVANQIGCLFKELSATGVGINDVRIVLEEAKNTLALTGKCVAYLYI